MPIEYNLGLLTRKKGVTTLDLGIVKWRQRTPKEREQRDKRKHRTATSKTPAKGRAGRPPHQLSPEAARTQAQVEREEKARVKAEQAAERKRKREAERARLKVEAERKLAGQQADETVHEGTVHSGAPGDAAPGLTFAGVCGCCGKAHDRRAGEHCDGCRGHGQNGRARKCGHPRAEDGKPCQNVGACPHHPAGARW